MRRKFTILFILIVVAACDIYSQTVNQQAPVDPFKLYTPSFNAAREQNDIYQEWAIFNTLLGVHKYVRYNPNLKDSICYVSSGTKKFEAAISFHAQYGIPLPESCKKMKINLLYEFQTINNSVFLMNIEFNDKTTLLRSTNIPLEPTFSFKDTIFPFSNKRIDVDIPDGANNCIFRLKTSSGQVVLGRCEIEIDGKKIETYTYDQSSPFSSPELQQIKKRLSGALVISNKSGILGIGESLHGSREFMIQATKMIKEKIANDGYHALFLEVPPTLGFYMNEYIQGKDAYTVTSVTDKIKNGYANSSYFIDLLNFIKTYNQKNREKVVIAGYDIVMNRNSLDSLFRDVASICPNSEELKSCMTLISELAKQDSRKVIVTIPGKNLVEIRSLLSKAIEKSKERHSFYECYICNYLLNWVENSVSIARVEKFKHNRDSLMANNVSFLLEHLSKNTKTIVHGHLGHIAKNKQIRELKGTFTSSMGYYLTQKYGETYSALGLYTGSGTFGAGRYEGYSLKVKKGVYPVSYPIGKSIEQMCLMMNKPSFYINGLKEISLLDRIVYERSQGVYWEPMQFEPVDIRKELDAIWFTMISTAL